MPKLSELPSKFPYEYEGHTILGVLPAGSRFKVAGVRKVTGPSMGYVYYQARVMSPEKFKDMLIDPTWLTPGGGLVPKFDPKLVEEVTGAGK